MHVVIRPFAEDYYCYDQPIPPEFANEEFCWGNPFAWSSPLACPGCCFGMIWAVKLHWQAMSGLLRLVCVLDGCVAIMKLVYELLWGLGDRRNMVSRNPGLSRWFIYHGPFDHLRMWCKHWCIDVQCGWKEIQDSCLQCFWFVRNNNVP